MATFSYELFKRGKGIVRFGLPAGGWYLYWSDIFHTLLNMPRHRFLLVFFCVYLTEYLIFALLYLTQPDRCVGGIMKFSHAMWFSVQTAATLGYTGLLQPNPDCASVNMLVILQVISAALVDYCMMGLVFARFASPNKRSFTIRFSSTAVLFQRPEDGLWCLSFRLANIRKHSLINPQISLMFALPLDSRLVGGRPPGGAPDSAGVGSGAGSKASGAAIAGGGNGIGNGLAHFNFRELPIEDLPSQVANLRLGLHAHINHIIRPGSPLFDRSLDELQALGAEVLCFMEGARHSYTPADIRMNERFVPIELKLRGGELGLDFTGFDATTAKALAAEDPHEVREGGFATFLVPVPGHNPVLTGGNSAVAAGTGAGRAGIGSPEVDVEAGWNRDGTPLVSLSGRTGRAGGADAAAAGPSYAGEVNTMMAVALSGDMCSHMQALRSQSIRSLTTPMLTLPQLVPSVATLATSTSSSAFAGNNRTSPPAAATLGFPGELADLFDAVLTDVGCSATVKRQAATLKEALSALELVPRGPAELAGRQL
ncbi:hypothetical protein VOLCADRAFT_118521 [Volvox carteri f. nagariensis]|uniref:Potassium channel inwardly rectifying transmembrane domain-containing protein n=1 Tax=Volvox carteri f. nagariensis TaxID=3068 RepID=D8U5I9_VOLCA|nr:uncharacterized protein VOLCADRAFT_118521 [Volvox carteri f. nagariensis]EFJ45008.1 hypothetical protein VOLCADRAFT_118521 [Volvox carteri f. nagariensis]|eukprot:XP_002953979.1 hypothetical protein VOLCADRAFT_118521 [Volvox carteri f. nagariensis]